MVVDRKALLLNYCIYKFESEHPHKLNLIKDELIYGTLKGQNG